MKTNRGRGGVKPISMLTLWKIAWFFKQQIEFLLISCLVVAKRFIKKAYIETFFIYQHINTFIVVIIDIYLCKKHCHLLCWVCKKIIIFSFFTPQFFIQKFISILHVKWTGMNMEKAGWKLDVLSEYTFWMTPKSFCCNENLHLIFNLTHYQSALMGSFHFPHNGKYFSKFIVNSYNVREWNISIINVKFEMW